MNIEQIAMLVFLGVSIGQWLTLQQLKGLFAPKSKRG
jgi:hypothetical protein